MTARRDLFVGSFAVGGTKQGHRAAPTCSPAPGRRGAPSSRPALLVAIAAVLLCFPTAAFADTTPTVSAETVSLVGVTTAKLSGKVNPDGTAGDGNTTWRLQYSPVGTDHGSGEENWGAANEGTIEPPASEEANEVEVEAIIGFGGELQPGQEYEFRLEAENGAGQAATALPYPTFTMQTSTAPVLTVEAPSSVTSTTAHFSGTVDPEGGNVNPIGPEAMPIHWEFEISSDGGSSWSSVGGGEISGAEAEGSTPIAVEVDAELIPNSHYELRLHSYSTNFSSFTVEADSPAPDPTFDTPAVKPDIRSATLFKPTPTSIQLNSLVNPHNATLSDCHFEWGAGATLDHTVPCESLPGGEGDVLVSVKLSGLTPGTSYSFRLLAANLAGSSEGPVRSFTTLAVPLISNVCPNEAIREAQRSMGLPECRAYEMVSPVDKNGGDIAADNSSVVAARDGNGIAYLARASFGDTVGSAGAGQTEYVSHRGASDWNSHAVTPMPRFDAAQITVTSTATLGFSDDLSHAVTFGYDLPGAEQSAPQLPNIYAERTADRSLQLVTKPFAGEVPTPQIFRQLFLFSFAAPILPGVSRDARHIAFKSLVRLLPEAPSVGSSVYSWDDGQLHLASILPDGNPAVGALMASPNPLGYRQSVSPDGSRVLFMSGGQLYMRVDAERTVLISESENPAFPGSAEEVVLQQTASDSRHIIFDTTSPLLETDENGGPDLYLYTDGTDPEHEEGNLTLLTETGDVPGTDTNNGTSVIGSSDDASRTYYYKNESILLWNRGETRVVAEHVAPMDVDHFRLAATAYQPGGARVSPDGRYLAFLAKTNVTGGGVPIAESDGHATMYLYDAKQDVVQCASCQSDGSSTADARIVPNITNIDPSVSSRGSRPSFLADDGKVFFSTSAALVPEDTNGVGDAYEYDPATARTSLLSSGRGATNSAFVDASADGKDVFIATRQELVGHDIDSLVDLYDVRMDGGFAEPPAAAPPCEGDACQKGATAPPAPSANSSSLAGTGNVKPRKRCTKGSRRTRSQRKGRCIIHRRHQRHPRHHRRQSGMTNREVGK